MGGRATGGGVENAGSLIMANSTVSGNSAGTNGGGLFNSFGTAIVTNSTVASNSAGIDGGGVFNNFNSSFSSSLTLSNSTVSGNSAVARGGGVDNVSGVSLTLTNSTVSGNNAVDGGGVNNSGNLTLTNSTVVGNSAGYGGGVYNGSGALTLVRTVVSGNGGTNGPAVYNTGSVTSTNFNVFGSASASGCSGFTPTTVGPTADIVPPVPAANILNPTLAFNGGPTRTHTLIAGGPAIDTVTNGSCPAPVADQRGFVRPFDGDSVGGAQCDSGAFELSALLPDLQNPQLTFMVLQPTRITIANADGCPGGMGFTHKFSFQARLTNLAGMPALRALKAVVTTLTSPRLLQNADGGAGGVGARLTVPEIGDLSDGVLGPGQSVDVPFVICLPNLNGFQLKVDVVGIE